MELISQKTPLFPQDWSIGRVVAWFAKLGVFVLASASTSTYDLNSSLGNVDDLPNR